MKTFYDATVHTEVSILVTWINGEPVPQMEPGSGIVAEIRKQVEGPPNLCDAGWTETLLIALAPDTVVPIISSGQEERFAEVAVVTAAYQIASIRVVYCSTVGEGILRLALVDTPKRLFRKARQEYHGSAQFRFHEPIANLTDASEKELRWTF